ncbi:MAG: TIGR00366 family protein [Planctomycetota bacterium]
MLSGFARRLADVAQRIVPDPFVIALGLTALAFGLGYAAMPGRSVEALAAGWYARVSHSGTLAFSFQMALILVAGATLASAPAVRGLLARLADVPQTTRGAAALTALVAMLAAYVNWGFGLIVGAVLAREIGARASARGRALDYPLVAAAGYTGLMIWHGGLSGSAPLKVAEGGSFGIEAIALDKTLFSPLNLALAAGTLVFVPWLVSRMASAGSEVPVRVESLELPRADGAGRRPGVSKLLGLFVIGLGALALFGVLREQGILRGLGLNTVNLGLVLLGLLLHRTPQRYAAAFGASAGQAGGILLQFPFYFGILGLLEASGLVGLLAGQSAQITRGLASVGLPLGWCFDMVTFASAALVNLFVPSGGGQWAVQGAVIAQACEELSLPLPRAVMALAYGDEWTNMLQPFWALPLLGITGLKARDILGYTLTIMLLAAPLYALAFALF